MRVHMIGERISCEQADILLYYLHNIKEIQAVKVYDRTADVTISYIGERADIIHILRRFQYENVYNGMRCKIHLERYWKSGKRKNRGSGSGCYCNRCIYVKKRHEYGIFYYVFAWSRRIVGGMDTQEIGG